MRLVGVRLGVPTGGTVVRVAVGVLFAPRNETSVAGDVEAGVWLSDLPKMVLIKPGRLSDATSPPITHNKHRVSNRKKNDVNIQNPELDFFLAGFTGDLETFADRGITGFSAVLLTCSVFPAWGGGVTTYFPSKTFVLTFDNNKACLNSSAVWKRFSALVAIALSITLANLGDTIGLRFRMGVSSTLSMARASPSSGMMPVRAA